MSSESLEEMISSEELQQMCQKLSAEPFKKVNSIFANICINIFEIFSDVVPNDF